MSDNQPAGKNVPSLDEAARVIDFILHGEMKSIADRVSGGAATTESLGELLGLTIAVVAATEHLYAVLGRAHPTQWESLERSSATFMDHYVVDLLAAENPELKRAVTAQR